jgi:hypothetical protein
MAGCTRESRRCEFWTQGEQYMRPACCTQHLKDILVFTHELLQRHDIPHWLDYGALLGAVRTGEFIPWDGDVDFGIMRNDMDRIRMLQDEVAHAGHYLNMSDPLVWRVQLSSTNALHADLFPWWVEDGVLKMRWRGYPDECWAFPRSFLDHVQSVELYGHSYPAPSPVEEFIQRYRYGPDYRIPRRSEELGQRTQIIPSVKRFLGRRIFLDRLRRNLDLLQETIDNTPFRGCYYVTMAPVLDLKTTSDDSPDAGFGYRRNNRTLFLEALPALQAAGFSVLGDFKAHSADDFRIRLSKDGARIDFVVCEPPGGAA